MTEVLRTCPVHSEAVANREYTPTLLAGSAAREIYPGSEKLEPRIQTLRDDIHNHYEQTGMWSYNPGKADFLEERAVVNALTAPIFHAIEVDIIQNAMPALLGETALRPSKR